MGLHVPIMKNNRPQISLRTLMAAMVGLLVAIALGFVILEYRNSYVAWRNAELMDERNRLAVTSLQAVDNFWLCSQMLWLRRTTHGQSKPRHWFRAVV